MSWTLDGTRIYTAQYNEKGDQIIARLQPLNNKTILHIFGYETEILSLAGLVVTSGDKETLKSFYKSGISHTLIGPEGTIGDFYVAGFKANRLPTVCLVLFDRPGLPTDAPAYDINMELFLDV